MKIILKIIIVAAATFMFAIPVLADESTPVQISFVDIDSAAAQEKVLKTQALALKRLEFEGFARTKVQQLNNNQLFSRSRMEITKQSDGTYLGRYHQIDDSTMAVKVRRSQSGTIPYVGVLSYQDQILESTASTLEQLVQSSFTVVKIIPNRHIFSYQKGAWK